jgi:hypothetical protein
MFSMGILPSCTCTGFTALESSRSLRATFSGSANGRSGVFHAATLSSLSAPRATIFSASSGNGRCSAFASQGARIQTSRSSSVVGITGMASGWIGSTTAFGDAVRKP